MYYIFNHNFDIIIDLYYKLTNQDYLKTLVLTKQILKGFYGNVNKEMRVNVTVRMLSLYRILNLNEAFEKTLQRLNLKFQKVFVTKFIRGCIDIERVYYNLIKGDILEGMKHVQKMSMYVTDESHRNYISNISNWYNNNQLAYLPEPPQFRSYFDSYDIDRFYDIMIRVKKPFRVSWFDGWKTTRRKKLCNSFIPLYLKMNEPLCGNLHYTDCINEYLFIFKNEPPQYFSSIEDFERSYRV